MPHCCMRFHFLLLRYTKTLKVRVGRLSHVVDMYAGLGSVELEGIEEVLVGDARTSSVEV
jgi:hypothetical protein